MQMKSILITILVLISGSLYSQEHPRLYFSQSDLPQLRSDTADVRSHIWQPLREYVEDNLSTPPPPASDPGNGLSFFRLSGDKLAAFALVAVITEENRFIQLAKDYMLAYASWEYWGEQEMRDLGHGHMLFGNAVAYDWLYQYLTTEERTIIGDTLASWTHKMYEASAAENHVSPWNNWWRHSYAQNHSSTTHGSMGVAALALLGDDPRAETWLTQADEKMSRIAAMLEGIGDGTWHEGGGYQGYMFLYSTQFMYNYLRLRDVDLFPHNYYLAHTRYRAYNYLPDSFHRIMAFGNFHWDWYDERGMTALTFIAGEYNDPVAQYLVEEYYDYVVRYCNDYSALTQSLQFLLFDPNVAALPPEEYPLGATFDDLQSAIWRESWQDSALIFGFKSGSYGGTFTADAVLNNAYPFEHEDASLNIGHDHDDMQGFYLHRNGEWLAPECVTYGETDAHFHNVVLADGQSHYRSTDGSDTFREYKTPSRAYLRSSQSVGRRAFLSSDGTNRLRNISDIRQWTRDVLYIRPEIMIITDDIEAGSSHDYEWVCHFNPDALNEIRDGWIESVTPGNQVFGIYTAGPAETNATLGYDAHPDAGYPDYPRVRIAASGSDIRYTHVLCTKTATDWEEKPSVSTLHDSDDGILLELSSETEAIRALIPDTSDSKGLSLGEYILDGEAATVTRSTDGRATGYFLAGGKYLSDVPRGITFIEAADSALWLDAELIGAVMKIRYLGTDQEVTLYAPSVSKLIINEDESEYTRNGDYITFNAREDVSDSSSASVEVQLNQNYPNPFHTATTISFSLSSSAEIELLLYNALGQKIMILQSGLYSAGSHEMTFQSEGLSSGVYFIQLRTRDEQVTRKALLVH
ncbi:MAG: DUF4962 domain-containing protein [Candidatus Marinimicrobia bacterium]|nr:DUF4962 domain-containing protein [Candidatus Neomarinimicrobiota bacterium]